MKKEGKGKKFIIFILILIVIGLGGYIYYIQTNDNDKITKLNNQIKQLKKENTVSEKSNEETDDFVGEYSATKEYEEAPSITETLDIMKDGTFYYKSSSTMTFYSYGTYKVENNVLTLNTGFAMENEIGSGTEYTFVITYTIGTDGTLTPKSSNDSRTHITLQKTSTEYNVHKEFEELLIATAKDYSDNCLTNQ